jgi:hypothetical protein
MPRLQVDRLEADTSVTERRRRAYAIGEDELTVAVLGEVHQADNTIDHRPVIPSLVESDPHTISYEKVGPEGPTL